MKKIRLSGDFHLELFATEPDVVDPVEMAFDENGRVYVAEMRDYPDDPPAGKPAARLWCGRGAGATPAAQMPSCFASRPRILSLAQFTMTSK